MQSELWLCHLDHPRGETVWGRNPKAAQEGQRNRRIAIWRKIVKAYRGRAYNGVIVLPVLTPIETTGDVVVMGLKDFYELLDHLSEPRGHPGLAQEIRTELDPELHG